MNEQAGSQLPAIRSMRSLVCGTLFTGIGVAVLLDELAGLNIGEAASLVAFFGALVILAASISRARSFRRLATTADHDQNAATSGADGIGFDDDEPWYLFDVDPAIASEFEDVQPSPPRHDMDSGH